MRALILALALLLGGCAGQDAAQDCKQKSAHAIDVADAAEVGLDLFHNSYCELWG